MLFFLEKTRAGGSGQVQNSRFTGSVLALSDLINVVDRNGRSSEPLGVRCSLAVVSQPEPHENRPNNGSSRRVRQRDLIASMTFQERTPRKGTAKILSEQLPCRSAEVKNFSVFLCQRCREIWREILVKFSALRFPGFGCATENFTKISRQKRCEKREISPKFHSAGVQR